MALRVQLKEFPFNARLKKCSGYKNNVLKPRHYLLLLLLATHFSHGTRCEISLASFKDILPRQISGRVYQSEPFTDTGAAFVASNASGADNVDTISRDARRKGWVTLTVVLIACTTLFFLIRFLLNKKLRNSLQALQQKKAIEKERIRIAANLHDDIGAELTNITLLSRILKYTAGADKKELMSVVDKIEASSNQLVTKMNEIIWTLNARNYTVKNLVAHIRNHVTSLNENTPLTVHFLTNETTEVNDFLGTEFTVNVFLVTKELLQNALKHSRANTIKMRVSLLDLSRLLCIEYTDNGIGFDTTREYTGNGLYNIKRRVTESQGTLELFSEPGNGCVITVLFPLIQNTYEHD